MGCDQYREALSAELDGEDTGVPEEALAAHLSGCSDCRGWFGRAARVTRLARMSAAAPMPDLVPGVLATLPLLTARRRRILAVARAALIVVAFLQALVAWSGALTGQDDMVTGHVAHEVGAWNLALAVTFLTVASRPRTADALITPIGVFVAVLAVVAVSDAAGGDLALGRLLGHLLVGTGFLLLVAVGRFAPPAPGTPERSRPRGLPRTPDSDRVPPSGAVVELVPGLSVTTAVTPSVRAGTDSTIETGSAA